MRDLGLPPLVENYPEPAIDVGIFPSDYADMYRDWHRQIENGAEHLEAIIPLTVGRVPFHVRYTTEFDENGKPLKAYGSATLVIEEDKELLSLLERDNISIDEVSDFKRHPIVDNDRPMICADRLDGIFLMGLIWTKSLSLEEVE